MEKQFTTIRISHELWKFLNENRTKPDETPEDVIWGFIRLPMENHIQEPESKRELTSSQTPPNDSEVTIKSR